MLKKFLILIFILTTGLSGACAYRIDIQQGNVVTDEMLAKLELGMPKRTVRFVLGNPVLHDSFHANRWDYFYSFSKGWEPEPERQHITVIFEGDTLTDVEGIELELPTAQPQQPPSPLQQPDGRPIL